MADNKENKVLKSSIEREQSQTCLNSAEREKIKGSKNLNVPHLRFPEFRGEWESSRLSSFAKKITKKNKGNIISNVLCNSANFGIIPQSEYFDRGIANTENTDTYYIIENGDFVYNPRKSVTAPYGPVNMYKGKNLGIISPLYLCFTVKDISKDFLLNWFKGNKWHRYVYSHGDTGVRYDRVSIKDDIFLDMPINIPVIAEQEKISKSLNLLEERIATQNKVIEDLKLLKSAIIEEIDNCRYSKKVRLGDIGLFVRGLTYSSNDIVENNGILVMRSNNIINGSPLDYNNNIVHVNKHISSDQHLQCGDVVICMANGSSTLVGKSSYYDGGCSLPITIGAFCGIYRSNEPLAKWLFQTSTYRRYIWNSLQGGNGAIANLNSDDILSMSFTIPDASTKDRFAKLLTYTDSAINSNTKLHSLYILQKHCLLRQMFI